jgi:NAD(P)-dependent dehydrogenase (short-subunit alcohol dehydrogenase family)
VTIDLTGRVAIVTGAGGGLGRAHALLLARYGAKVVVNDAGGARDGREASTAPAERVADEIVAAGGEAMASGASVTDFEQVRALVEQAEARWGQIDILVNNAGILRDKTFAKTTLEDFRAVLDVHLMGAVHTTKAVWPGMMARGYGRIVMTSSSSGLFGNFGQSSYAAAKMALVGLAKTLALEGARYGICVNCLAPSATTRMTDGVLSEDMYDMLSPGKVSPAIVALSAETAPTGATFCAGAGSFERAYVTMTRGIVLRQGDDTAEAILGGMDAISDRTGEMIPTSGPEQARWEVDRVALEQVGAL